MDLESIVATALDAEILMSRSVARAKALLDSRVDIALLDVDVTNGKTFEVAMLLRLREVPFVFLTGSPHEHIPDEFRDAPFMAKPYDRRRLVEQIHELIRDDIEPDG
jgi:DNA-binding LytR/AlgR family response regulator